VAINKIKVRILDLPKESIISRSELKSVLGGTQWCTPIRRTKKRTLYSCLDDETGDVWREWIS
jgi:hypothetical protein